MKEYDAVEAKDERTLNIRMGRDELPNKSCS
jgi:hypothetical protein